MELAIAIALAIMGTIALVINYIISHLKTKVH